MTKLSTAGFSYYQSVLLNAQLELYWGMRMLEMPEECQTLSHKFAVFVDMNPEDLPEDEHYNLEGARLTIGKMMNEMLELNDWNPEYH